jgi:hypothetical protein
MRRVLDANCFQDPLLDEYLRSSTDNFVVFTDFACMETYKPASVANIYKSIQVAARYPAQVLVLKPTPEIIRLQDRDPHLGPDEFVDVEQTKGFAKFCEGVRRAAGGDKWFERQVLGFRREALRHFDRMLSDAEGYGDSIAAVRGSLTAEHVRALRERAPLSPGDGQKMIEMILWIAGILFRDHPEVTRLPKPFSAARKTHIFRIALANYVLAARWIGDGGAVGVKSERLRNDIVDMTYVAFATQFDGLLSRDKKMLELYEETRFILDEVFVD